MEFNIIIDIKNNLPLKEFCGLSPAQMHQIYYYHRDNDVIRIKESKDANFEIPFLTLIAEIIMNIDFDKGLRLTATGNLPVKIVKKIYEKKIIPEFDIDDGITILSKETDSDALHCAKIIGILSGNLRKANNRIFVTKKGKTFRDNTHNLKDILITFGTKFNLAYFDGYDDVEIGKQSYIFSLYLIKKYGDKKRNQDYYANKYFIAFPQVDFKLDQRNSCYCIRMFYRFFRYFGLINMTGNYLNENIEKTSLFEKYISFNL